MNARSYISLSYEKHDPEEKFLHSVLLFFIMVKLHPSYREKIRARNFSWSFWMLPRLDSGLPDPYISAGFLHSCFRPLPGQRITYYFYFDPTSFLPIFFSADIHHRRHGFPSAGKRISGGLPLAGFPSAREDCLNIAGFPSIIEGFPAVFVHIAQRGVYFPYG